MSVPRIIELVLQLSGINGVDDVYRLLNCPVLFSPQWKMLLENKNKEVEAAAAALLPIIGEPIAEKITSTEQRLPLKTGNFYLLTNGIS